MLSTPDVTLFLSIRHSIDRSAFTRYRQERGIDARDRAAIDLCRLEFLQTKPLGDQNLHRISHHVISIARGRYLSGNEPFHLTIWMHGATNRNGGRAFTGSFRQFAEVLLVERAKHVAAKRDGWVIEPTTNPSGERTNEATFAMHALFLDCDSTGEWHNLHAALTALGFAFVLYQSGGWSPTTPKWRAVIPLDHPFDVSSAEKREAWKISYNHARVCFGALGGLASIGFDPATETPCNPWFLTEKRTPEDTTRQIIYSPGYSLDLEKLTSLLPTVPKTAHSDDEERGAIERISIDEEQFEKIVDALSASTAHVPIGRRDIYLAMPAVLLNRGVAPDDVRTIVEEVSSRYPRQHADKHADNMHCVETTIDKWESEGANARITQIGTLQALAPEVAAALDEALPDPTNSAMAEIISRQLSTTAETSTVVPVGTEIKLQVQPRRTAKRPKLPPHVKKLTSVAKRLCDHKNSDRRTEGLLLTLMLRGESFPAEDSVMLDKLVGKLSRVLGYHLPSATWQDAFTAMGPSLLALDFTQSVERVKEAERQFWEGRRARNKATAKREEKKRRERLERASDGASR